MLTLHSAVPASVAGWAREPPSPMRDQGLFHPMAMGHKGKSRVHPWRKSWEVGNCSWVPQDPPDLSAASCPMVLAMLRSYLDAAGKAWPGKTHPGWHPASAPLPEPPPHHGTASGWRESPVAAAGAWPCGERQAEPLTKRKFRITSRSLGCPGRAQRGRGGKGGGGRSGHRPAKQRVTKAKRRRGVRGHSGAGEGCGMERGRRASGTRGTTAQCQQLAGTGPKAGRCQSRREEGDRCGRKQRTGRAAAGGSRRGTYQRVPREHLQQRDEVVAIPQVLVEIVDMTLRLQGW